MKVEPSEEYVKNVLAKYMEHTTVEFASGELRYDGDVSIIWARGELLYHIYAELENLMSESALSVLKRIGKPYGTSFYNMMKEKGMVERLTTEENIYKYLVCETMAIGWGKITLEKEDDTFNVVSDNGLPVGNAHRKQGKKSGWPIDTYFMGYIEGFLTEMHGKPYKGDELECVGKGDARCVMIFKPSI